MIYIVCFEYKNNPHCMHGVLRLAFTLFEKCKNEFMWMDGGGGGGGMPANAKTGP